MGIGKGQQERPRMARYPHGAVFLGTKEMNEMTERIHNLLLNGCAIRQQKGYLHIYRVIVFDMLGRHHPQISSLTEFWI